MISSTKSGHFQRWYVRVQSRSRNRALTAMQWPVSMTVSEVLLDGDIFEDPKAFKPERWLTDDNKLQEDYRAAFVPFGRGTRACQGQS